VRTELLVALVSGAVALSSAALAIWGQFRSARIAAEIEQLRFAEQRRVESEKAISRYREPLARAAYDLQSRLYNILEHSLISAYFDNGDERERAYVVDNTVFLVAQYLAWTEIIPAFRRFGHMTGGSGLGFGRVGIRKANSYVPPGG
jgi:hypothetical protein